MGRREGLLQVQSSIRQGGGALARSLFFPIHGQLTTAGFGLSSCCEATWTFILQQYIVCLFFSALFLPAKPLHLLGWRFSFYDCDC